ncbi:cell surface protein SprA [Chitinophaga sp. ysch24]|uniref:Cell surface protein SprA n=2 Tax=Chitinophaga tropicalis TaxID=2683588 RepID=A0A7K1UBG7_9BACT|nr:cell surface protein SprA [Chitinophaga tropicalis]
MICLFIAGTAAGDIQRRYVHSITRDSVIPVKATPDTLKYPITDRHAPQLIEGARNTMDLKDPSGIKQSVEYDPVTGQYTISEKIGDSYYRQPTLMSFKDFYDLQSRKSEEEYFRKRAATLGNLNRTGNEPALVKSNNLFDRLFGGNKVDIKPQGFLEVSLGYDGQYINNPVLTEQARRSGGLAMDMNINLNVTGKIGDKLKIITNYNTQSTFDFENQIKLEYTGYSDEIIKKIEAGNVSFPLSSSLISGMQSLFGIKTQLQFGRLMITSVLSSQKSEKQTLTLKGGSQSQSYTIKANAYDDNRHFLMAQFFRDTFNYAMGNLPSVRSMVNITRLEVWVTNKTGTTTNTRNVVALMDLAEYNPYNTSAVQVISGGKLPFNGINNLYSNLNDDAARNPFTVVSRLQAAGLAPVQDYEKTYARKLDSTEYTVNRKLGYISLNSQLASDQVLAVAYEYSYNGRTYKVGDFAQDLPPDESNSANSRVLFLKMLKATAARPALPIWDLMMKNIYSTGAYQVSNTDFTMDIYYNDPGNDSRASSQRRYLPDAVDSWSGAPIISIVNLDNLNNNNDPQPDGVFDFVSGYTIDPSNGRIIFPVLEPFGKDLAKAFGGDAALEKQYLYTQLYDSTKTAAEQFTALNRFLLKGSYKAGSSSEVSLNAFNIPSGSVTVTSGGRTLTENIDYVVDYNLGRVKIINDGILSSGNTINVSFENGGLYGQQVRNYSGTRLDYAINDKLNIGSTIVHMSERPYTNKVNYGEDPINNTVVGLDGNYNSEWKGLTRLLDKLPYYSTKTPSMISLSGEGARLFPGHSKLINNFGTSEGQIYIDDFEGTQSNYDLKSPSSSWVLASTPAGATDSTGAIMFPEATQIDSLGYGKNRALLAWYIIEPTLQLTSTTGLPAGITRDDQSDPRVRIVYQQEIFPNISTGYSQTQLPTLDLAYYPDQRGPYNFETDRTALNDNGTLKSPKKRWAGIMRSLDNTDFENSNIQYIEFWLQDPFIKAPTSTGGDLYFNLGSISEDVLKDSRKFFENGLKSPSTTINYDSSSWGRVPNYEQQLTRAFDNDASVRQYQDVGYDGLGSADEAAFRSAYLTQLRNNFGANSPVYQAALADPSNDNYHYYRGDDYDAEQLSIQRRYKRFSMPEGNSPATSGNATYSSAATNTPESEDLNNDNTMNETEAYFQYRVHMQPNMEIGANYIVDKINTNVTLANGSTSTETWYQFKIPVDQYNAAIGGITDFKSIRFMRMFLTNFQDSVVLRFGKLGLVRNQWRQYRYELQTGAGDMVNTSTATTFNTTAVNIEENASRTPVPYVLPPGLQRSSTVSTSNTTLLLNEQSLSMQVCNLQDGKGRAVYKTLGMDLRRYKKLQMFIHAEAVDNEASLNDNDLEAVIRLGSDFTENFYEYRIPLKKTAFGSKSQTAIWPTENELNLLLTDFSNLKLTRNNAGASTTTLYEKTLTGGNTIAVIGNPNLGNVEAMMIAVYNPQNDGSPKCGEIWFDELRLSGMDEKGGYAATGRLNLQLADLGTLALSGNMHTAGYGAVNQSVNERFQDNLTQYDASLSLDMGKLLPKKANIAIPVYAGQSKSNSLPEYDPFDADIKLKDKLNMATSKRQRDSIRQQAQDVTTITSLNVTNMRKLSNGKKKLKPWSIENLDLTYAYTGTRQHNPITENYELTKNRGVLGYNYSTQGKYIQPFKKLFKSKSAWLALIRDFNFNPLPSSVNFRADLNRQFSATRLRNVGSDYKLRETYSKYFNFDRYYGLKWDLTRNLSFDLTAVNNARVDEPEGRINTQAKKDSLWSNLKKLGRTTNYFQTFNATYALPMNKLPLLNWTSIAVNYTAQYRWTAASLSNRIQGNTIENSQATTIVAEFKLSDLYNKSKFLKQVTANPQQPAKSTPGKNTAAAKKPAEPPPPEISPLVKGLLKPLLAVKRISINYSENNYTSLPGYMDSTQALGMNWRSMQPGLAFVFGYQPDSKWLDEKARKGLISRDTLFNSQFRQQFSQSLNVQAQLEPVNSLRIDLSLTKTFSKTHTELFKDRYGAGNYEHLDPYETGGFQVTSIMLKTFFGKGGLAKAFTNFRNYRTILSRRYWNQNPYTKDPDLPVYDTGDASYMYGYGKYEQNVLISSFLAAYTGKDPEKIGLIATSGLDKVRSNPFRNIIPLPNWRVTYDGLSRLEPFSSLVQSLILTHAYVSNISMNSFNSTSTYLDKWSLGNPSFIDTLSGNYVPYYTVPNITMMEQMSPLLGIDMTLKNNLNMRIEYRTTRSLSLNLTDYQLVEAHTGEITVGGGYRIRGLILPFAIGPDGSRKLDNDLNLRMDIGYRDEKSVNHQLDGSVSVPTSGQKVISIAPSVDYVLNKRMNLKFFYTRKQTIPVLSTASPTITTSGGLTLRFMLGQ